MLIVLAYSVQNLSEHARWLKNNEELGHATRPSLDKKKKIKNMFTIPTYNTRIQ